MKTPLATTLLLFILSYVPGCASKPVMLQPAAHYQRAGWIPAFTSEDWQFVLNSVVTPEGYVRWDVLQKNPNVSEALKRYVSLIGQISPVNRPDLVQTKDDQIAYWINAYNATCMYGVYLRNVSNPPELYSKDVFSFGGEPLTLDQVEDVKIKALDDPRVVFGINHCTRSSPPLRKEPYNGDKLNRQLVDQGKIFLNDERGVVREDEVAKVNELVAVKYGPAFVAAYQKRHGVAGTLWQAIVPYAAKHSGLAAAKTVVAMEYDGSLNRP